MAVAQLDLLTLLKLARTDMLAALNSLPIDAELSRARFGIPFVVAQQFSTAQRVLVADADSYRKPWFIRQVIRDGLGENLFTTEGPAWLARRQPCAPVFGVFQMEGLATTMVESISDTINEWEPGEIDIQDAMTDLTLRVALRGLLGVDHETSEIAAEVQAAFEEILDWITFRFNRPVSAPTFVPTSRNRQLKAAKTRLRSAIAAIVSHRRAHDNGSVDVLSQLVRAQQNGAHALTDQAILDECIGFMFAGHETTAATLTWALYELSLRSELQDLLAVEGAQLRANPGALTKTVDAMENTSGVVEEALRMYPAGIAIARSAKRTTTLSGVKVRRGTMVLIPVYTIQRSPTTWDDPEEFNSSRHIDGNGEGFLPFGLGPRRCLGARFARTELRIALGLICDRWQMTYEQAEPPLPVVAPSLRAEGELTLRISGASV